jgi:hypothetical protein
MRWTTAPVASVTVSTEPRWSRCRYSSRAAVFTTDDDVNTAKRRGGPLGPTGNQNVADVDLGLNDTAGAEHHLHRLTADVQRRGHLALRRRVDAPEPLPVRAVVEGRRAAGPADRRHHVERRPRHGSPVAGQQVATRVAACRGARRRPVVVAVAGVLGARYRRDRMRPRCRRPHARDAGTAARGRSDFNGCVEIGIASKIKIMLQLL